MKTSMKLLMLVSVVCLVSSAAIAQKKTARKARNAPSTICKVASVPKGMVIVGYKKNQACGEAMELLVKRPDVIEIICADSPVPNGYSVGGVQGSAACNTGNSNPLTNALAIWSGDAAPASAPRESVSRGYNVPSARNNSAVDSAVNQRAQRINAEAQRENAERENNARLQSAATQKTIMVGMTMAQVKWAWGSPDDVNSRTTESGTTSTWTYKSAAKWVFVHFDEAGIVTSYSKV